ncbi:MAG: DUF975 family protein [Lactobacillus sp.]|jgi:uncharacterized membrane protein|nr:DUF975 family protein [Lactobacillus sp.]
MNTSTAKIKTVAKTALRGHWVQPVLLLVTTYLITYLLDSILVSIFDPNAFMYVLLLMLLNYFVIFALDYGQYYYPMSLFGHQKFSIAMLFVGYNKFFYKRLVVLNFIKSILLTLSSLLVFIPFIGKLNWLNILSLMFNTSDITLFNRLFKIVQQFTMGHLLALLGLLIVFGLIFLLLEAFFQITGYLVFENAQNPSAHFVVSGMLLLKGHWGQLLRLQLSFIIWYFFYAFTFVWLIPYRQMAIFVFYLNLKQDFAQKLSAYTNEAKTPDSDDQSKEDND